MSVFSLTTKQQKFVNFREIKVGGLYMFPNYTFNVYKKDGSREQIPCGLFNNLDNQSFVVDSIENGICYGNFFVNPLAEPFGINVFDLKLRRFSESLFIKIFCYPYFVIQNILGR